MNVCLQPEQLIHFLDGQMATGSEETVALHVSGCETCQTLLDELAAIPLEISQRVVEADTGWSDELAHRITDHVESEVSSLAHRDLGRTPDIPGCEVGRLIGRGGMGEVYLAWQRGLQRLVAVKVLPPSLANSSGFRSRFAREMAAVGRLRHPGVVTAYDAGEQDGVPYLIMEYVDGRNLSAVVRQTGPLSIAKACDVIRQAALAIEAAHQQGLVHRDIKPANLMLTSEGTVKVLDLGLSSFAHGAFDGELTGANQVLGTFEYMAPEQANGAKGDARSDIFSLGATWFKLLTGTVWLDTSDMTPAAKLIALTQGEPPRIKDVRNDVPAELAEVIDRMLAKAPDDRFTSMAEVIVALNQIQMGQHKSEGLHSVRDAPKTDIDAQPSVNGPTVKHPRVAVSSDLRRSDDSHRRTATAGWCLLVLAMLGIVIIIKSRDGMETRIKVPEGSLAQIIDAPETDINATPDTPALPRDFWQAGPVDSFLPGLIPTPRKVPGIRRWQLETVRGRRGDVEVLAWNPKQPVIACGSRHGVIRLCDAQSLKLINCLAGHADSVNDVAWNADGTLLATASGDQTVRLWSADGRQGPVLEGHADVVTSVSWNPHTSLLASSSDDKTIRLWKPEEGCLKVLHGHADRVICVAWSPDGQRLASSSRDSTIQIWDVDGMRGQTIHVQLTTGRLGRRLAWSPDGEQLAVPVDRSIQVWNVNGTLGPVLEGHTSAVLDVAWSPACDLIASGAADDTVRVWRSDGTLLATSTSSFGYVRAVDWSPDGRQVLSGASDGGLRTWTSRLEILAENEGAHWSAHSIAWHPNGKVLAAGGFRRTGTIHLFNADGAQLRRLAAHKAGRVQVAWNADGSLLASCSADGTVRLWDEHGEPQQVFAGHEGIVATVDWSPDGRRLASGGYDKTVRIWHAAGAAGPTLQGHKDHVYGLDWSPDGTQIVSTGRDGTLWAWQPSGDKSGRLLTKLGTYGQSLAWQPSGGLLAVGLSAGPGRDSIRLVQPDGELQAAIRNDSMFVNDVAWSPGGQELAVYDEVEGRSSRMQLWKVDGTPGTLLQHQGDRVTSVAWTCDGERLAASDSDGTITIWDAATGRTRRKTVLISASDSITFSPDGTILDGDRQAINDQLIYIVERDDGRFSMLTPSEFDKFRRD